MGIVFVLLPASLLLAALFVGAFRWAAGSGQFDDPDHEALRVMFDEAPHARPYPRPVLEEKQPDVQ